MKSSALFPFVVLIMAAHSVRAADLPQLGDPSTPTTIVLLMTS